MIRRADATTVILFQQMFNILLVNDCVSGHSVEKDSETLLSPFLSHAIAFLLLGGCGQVLRYAL